MTQDSGTRGGTFTGEMDRCRERQGWTTVCSSTSERDGKDQGQDSPKQAGSCWFTRHSRLATSGANLYLPSVWSANVISSLVLRLFCFVSFSSFCFH